MRASIYARYSSDLQNNRSIEDQLRDCAALCGRRGWTVIDTFSDAAISGATMRRPGLSALLELASAGGVDVVVAEALDRLSRGLANTAQIHEALEEAGVRIHTLSEGDVRLIDVGLKGTMNALFITELRAKIMRGQRGNIANGRTAGGLAYGYRVVRKFDDRGQPIGGLREIDETAADIVRRIYREYVGGVSPFAIAASLNREGVPGPRGGRWNVSTIVGHRQRGCGILHNETYRGVLSFNRTHKQKNRTTGQQLTKINTQDQWVRQQVEALRIIDDETWTAAQARKSAHPSGGEKGNLGSLKRSKRLLSGLVRCAHCDGPYTVHEKDKMVCRNRRENGACWNPVRVPIGWLERRVLKEVQTALLRPEAVETFVQTLHQLETELQANAGAGRRRKAKELSDLKGKISRLLAALEEGGETSKTVVGRIRELEGRMTAVEADLAATEPEKVVRLHADAVRLYRAKVEGLHKALTVDATDLERAWVREALPTLIEYVSVRSVPGLRRKGHGLEIELVGLLPAYIASQAGAGSSEIRGENKPWLGRGVQLERVKGIEPSS